MDTDSSIYCVTFVSMLKDVEKEYKLGKHVEDYFFKASIIFFLQFFIVYLVLNGTIGSHDDFEFVEPKMVNMMLRLFTCYLFHLSNYRDIADAFRRLKFLRYNPEKFVPKYIPAAFLCCVFQFSAAMYCEGVNIFFLTKQSSLVNLICNYCAFAGISEIDNLYCEAQRNMKGLDAIPKSGVDNPKLDEMLTYTKKNYMNEDDRPSVWDPKCKDRRWLIRLIILIFPMIRYIYKVVYFYVFPYSIVFLSYFVFKKSDV